MKIIVAGGTGFVGRCIIPRLLAAGHAVRVLSRRPVDSSTIFPSGVSVAGWDMDPSSPWAAEIGTADAVLNFAGESLAGGRWTAARKRRLVDSRVIPTRALVSAMHVLQKKPRVFVSASAVGYYGSVGEGDVIEEHGPGTDFLATTCARWEQEANVATDAGVRVVNFRMGLVLGNEGGVLTRLALPFRLFAGGTLGSGRQWVSWIHGDDLASCLIHVLETPEVGGAVNITAPNPVRMGELSSELGAALHRPSWLHLPPFVLRLALGEMSGMLLTGQRVIPARLLRSGVHFRFPLLRDALADLFG